MTTQPKLTQNLPLNELTGLLGKDAYMKPAKQETVQMSHIEKDAVIKELLKALGIADRWFDKLLYDGDFTPLAINDPLKPLLEEAHSKIIEAIKKCEGLCP